MTDIVKLQNDIFDLFLLSHMNLVEELQQIKAPTEFELPTEDNLFFPNYKVHVVVFCSPEKELTCMRCFPPLDKLQFLEKNVDPFELLVLTERSNHFMESFSEKWKRYGSYSYDEGVERLAAFVVKWRLYVIGIEKEPGDLSARGTYDLLGSILCVSEGGGIVPKDLNRFPFLNDPEKVTSFIESIGGKERIKQYRTRLSRFMRLKDRTEVVPTLCCHCWSLFDRPVRGRSGNVCKKDKCRKAKDRKRKKEESDKLSPKPFLIDYDDLPPIALDGTYVAALRDGLSKGKQLPNFDDTF